MAEVPPYQRLEPGAQPWGRWVTDRTASHDNAIESLRNNSRAQNQSLTAQLNRLQAQISDLSERKIYYGNAAINDFIALSGASAYVQREVARIYFSIDTPRTVVFTAQTSYLSDLAINSPNFINGYADITIDLWNGVTGVYTGVGGIGAAFTGHTNSASGTIATRAGGTIVASAVGSLPAGRYYGRIRIGASVSVSGGSPSVGFNVGGAGGPDTSGRIEIGDPA